MSDCLHCDINELIQKHVEGGTDDLDAADVSSRMSTARSRAKRATSGPDMPLAPLLTGWAWVKQKVKVS